jgi:hypothetical protein
LNDAAMKQTDQKENPYPDKSWDTEFGFLKE